MWKEETYESCDEKKRWDRRKRQTKKEGEPNIGRRCTRLMSTIEQQWYRQSGDNLRMVIVKPTDRTRDTIEAYSIPGDVFNSVVKMIISSDASDARQERKRATT